MVIVYLGSGISYPESINELNGKAEEFYYKKQYTEALSLWLDILTIDQNNMRAMQKIEEVYEIKQKKDMAFQRSKYGYRQSKTQLKKEEDKEIEAGITIGWDAINTFKVAYRLDPNDLDVKDLRERLRVLEKELVAAEEAMRLSKAIKLKIQELRIVARDKQEKELYEGALGHWEEIIEYLPKDTEANEGKRNCLFAIDNRIRFEKIKAFLGKGMDLFTQKQYKLAKNEYTQVLDLDSKNREARNQIEKIDDILEDQMLKEVKLQQAETIYQSGVTNLANYNFEQARDEFESVLDLVKNYKDTKQKLASIEDLKKEFEIKERQKKLQLIDTLFQEGLLSYNENKYETAIARFDKTLSLDPKNDYAKIYLEKAMNALKEKQEETVDENSSYYGLVNSLSVSGKELYDKGKYSESAKKWDRILKLFPKNRLAQEFNLKCYYKIYPEKLDIFSNNLFASGQKLLKDKKFKEASDKFLLLKAINYSFPGINAYIEKSKAEPVEYGETAIAPVDRAEIERKYQAALAIYQKGGKENAERALATFKWIVQKNPNNIKAMINLNKIAAQLRITQGNVPEAMAQLTPELRRKAQQHYYNGIGFYSNNNFKKAIDEWQKVLLIDPGNIKARNNIRKTMAFLGRYGNE